MAEQSGKSPGDASGGRQPALDAGAFTRLPRWTLPAACDPPRTAACQVPLPPGTGARLVELAHRRSVEPATVMLAIHMRVLGIVASEREVLTGYVPAGQDEALLCQVDVAGGTWRDLLMRSRTAVRKSWRPRPTDPPFETMIDTSGLGGGRSRQPKELPGGIALRVECTGAGDALRIVLHHRTDVVDTSYAARLAGYYATALADMLSDPEAPHEEQCLLSAVERQHQLHDLAGPKTPLPDLLFVELFEEQARIHAARPAAAHRGTSWSYQELDERANHIAHGLLDAGLNEEDVVAVVMDRTLNWVAATIGVLKAGGVYMPLRPDFPAERIATQIERSRCRFVLLDTATEASPPNVPRALCVRDLYSATTPTTSPGVSIRPEQLAYIYFTSGSTGIPKGAMCEHAGMLNHLLAKIDDTGLQESDTVAQIASQCFDISLWQMLAPLLVGGSVRLVDTDILLDVNRFLDSVVKDDIDVLQIVPSYFEVLLNELELRPRDLGSLRCLSITGEALKLDLVRRWFDLYQDIRLINAYGATEVSDDTMHEVLDHAPERDFVSVGRSLRNVHTYILDERQQLVPLGSPGQIAFSGVCVGRGYINDEQRTREAFVADPHLPGNRMYLTGDFGRWLPEGTIEYLGRRDHQVKIRGFRVEIGEIENKLLAIERVREAAVVIDDGTNGDPKLVAFYADRASPPTEAVHAALVGSLPDYMVPAYLHRLQSLPLTENGKVDRKMLSNLGATLGHAEAAHVAPQTSTERHLAAAWAEVLGVPLEKIGRTDHFFQLGGTSLAAVRLVVQLDRMVRLKHLIRNPVLADLAAAVDGVSTHRPDELLQPLSAAALRPIAALICFPYAAGSAVNFQTLATELEPEGIAVYGVELPGHDFAAHKEPLAEVAEVARRVSAEIQEHIDVPVLLWGHCAGAAHAIEVARLLEADGAQAHRLYIGALLLSELDELDRETARATSMDDSEIIRLLLADTAYIELDQLKSERAELVGSAYRHDVRSTNEFLAELRQSAGPTLLKTATDVVIATDDPTTPTYEERHHYWGLVADQVELHEISGGGHYFTSTRATDVAALVVAACGGLRR